MSSSRYFMLCIILGSFVSSDSILLRSDGELTHHELMTMLRPTLSPMVRAMIDEIERDPAMNSLDEADNWQRMKLAINILMKNATFRSIIIAEGEKKMHEQINAKPIDYSFPCKPIPRNTSAKTVHELTPNDINVVAAMGDSITAGTGISALTALGILLQFRGESWSVGGNDLFETNPMLPNILRKYNEGIYGYSTGICRSSGRCAKMNVAIPGKTARDMSAQARDLIQKMKTSDVVDFQNDWKMVTIFIGQNDICSSSCKHPATYTAEMYGERLRDALTILYNEMPRTFVNLVSMVDAYQCKNLNIGILCTLLHLLECPCGAFDLFYEKTKALNEAYQRQTRIIAKEYERKPKSDFTIVVQPFFEHTVLPKKSNGEVDMSYFAPDCFHFSAKGHAAGAKSLWNNMLEPLTKKRTSWHEGMPYECPTEKSPYFCTSQNCNNQ